MSVSVPKDGTSVPDLTQQKAIWVSRDLLARRRPPSPREPTPHACAGCCTGLPSGLGTERRSGHPCSPGRPPARTRTVDRDPHPDDADDRAGSWDAKTGL